MDYFIRFNKKMDVECCDLNKDIPNLHLKISDPDIPSSPPILSTSDEHHSKTSITSSNTKATTKTTILPSSTLPLNDPRIST